MEEAPLEVGGMAVPVDASKPNPNNIEFDNLYLDMNGIIHPCCHPEGEEQPETEDEMILNIFKYVERVFNLVRPRQLLYLAIGTFSYFSCVCCFFFLTNHKSQMKSFRWNCPARENESAKIPSFSLCKGCCKS